MSDVISNIASLFSTPLLKTLGIIFIALVLQQITKRIVNFIFNNRISKIEKKSHISIHLHTRKLKTIGTLIKGVVIFGIWFIAIISILSIYNIPIAPLLTSAGLIGAGIAFGMQSLIRDFISGIFIILENQYRVGDYIELDKVSGRVENISIRTTSVRDDNGSLHHVPNGSIIVTTNYSMGKIKFIESIDVSSKISVDQFKIKLDKIAKDIASNEDLSQLIKEGPKLQSISKISKDSFTVNIEFTSTSAKHNRARTLLLTLIIQEKIALA
jgi:small conductance mechanosensitive channel